MTASAVAFAISWLVSAAAAQPYLCGDCNQNGLGPDIIDALTASQIAVALITPSTCQTFVCDVNNDAAISVIDALLMAQFSAGLPVALNCAPSVPSISSVGWMAGGPLRDPTTGASWIAPGAQDAFTFVLSFTVDFSAGNCIASSLIVQSIEFDLVGATCTSGIEHSLHMVATPVNPLVAIINAPGSGSSTMLTIEFAADIYVPQIASGTAGSRLEPCFLAGTMCPYIELHMFVRAVDASTMAAPASFTCGPGADLFDTGLALLDSSSAVAQIAVDSSGPILDSTFILSPLDGDTYDRTTPDITMQYAGAAPPDTADGAAGGTSVGTQPGSVFPPDSGIVTPWRWSGDGRVAAPCFSVNENPTDHASYVPSNNLVFARDGLGNDYLLAVASCAAGQSAGEWLLVFDVQTGTIKSGRRLDLTSGQEGLRAARLAVTPPELVDAGRLAVVAVTMASAEPNTGALTIGQSELHLFDLQDASSIETANSIVLELDNGTSVGGGLTFGSLAVNYWCEPAFYNLSTPGSQINVAIAGRSLAMGLEDRVVIQSFRVNAGFTVANLSTIRFRRIDGFTLLGAVPLRMSLFRDVDPAFPNVIAAVAIGDQEAPLAFGSGMRGDYVGFADLTGSGLPKEVAVLAFELDEVTAANNVTFVRFTDSTLTPPERLRAVIGSGGLSAPVNRVFDFDITDWAASGAAIASPISRDTQVDNFLFGSNPASSGFPSLAGVSATYVRSGSQGGRASQLTTYDAATMTIVNRQLCEDCGGASPPLGLRELAVHGMGIIDDTLLSTLDVDFTSGETSDAVPFADPAPILGGTAFALAHSSATFVKPSLITLTAAPVDLHLSNATGDPDGADEGQVLGMAELPLTNSPFDPLPQVPLVGSIAASDELGLIAYMCKESIGALTLSPGPSPRGRPTTAPGVPGYPDTVAWLYEATEPLQLRVQEHDFPISGAFDTRMTSVLVTSGPGIDPAENGKFTFLTTGSQGGLRNQPQLLAVETDTGVILSGVDLPYAPPPSLAPPFPERWHYSIDVVEGRPLSGTPHRFLAILEIDNEAVSGIVRPPVVYLVRATDPSNLQFVGRTGYGTDFGDPATSEKVTHRNDVSIAFGNGSGDPSNPQVRVYVGASGDGAEEDFYELTFDPDPFGTFDYRFASERQLRHDHPVGVDKHGGRGVAVREPTTGLFTHFVSCERDDNVFLFSAENSRISIWTASAPGAFVGGTTPVIPTSVIDRAVAPITTVRQCGDADPVATHDGAFVFVVGRRTPIPQSPPVVTALELSTMAIENHVLLSGTSSTNNAPIAISIHDRADPSEPDVISISSVTSSLTSYPDVAFLAFVPTAFPSGFRTTETVGASTYFYQHYSARNSTTCLGWTVFMGANPSFPTRNLAFDLPTSAAPLSLAAYLPANHQSTTSEGIFRLPVLDTMNPLVTTRTLCDPTLDFFDLSTIDIPTIGAQHRGEQALAVSVAGSPAGHLLVLVQNANPVFPTAADALLLHLTIGGATQAFPTQALAVGEDPRYRVGVQAADQLGNRGFRSVVLEVR